MTKAERYVRQHLGEELEEVKNSPIASVDNGLTIYEKTLIYHYTKNGYKAINDELRNRKGKPRSELSILLEKALKKLPAHKGLVHRTIELTPKQTKLYQDASDVEGIVQEPAFISSSRSPLVARVHPKFNVKFQIMSKRGRSVEDVSYMGSHSEVNEEEVIFAPGTSYKVLGATNMGKYLLIKMEEK